MITNAYRNYLRSPAWKVKREQAFNYYGRKCYACQTRRGPLQIHHLTYARLGRELMADLRPLCQSCHREVTRLHWKLGKRKFTGQAVFAIFMKAKRNGNGTRLPRK